METRHSFIEKIRRAVPLLFILAGTVAVLLFGMQERDIRASIINLQSEQTAHIASTVLRHEVSLRVAALQTVANYILTNDTYSSDGFHRYTDRLEQDMPGFSGIQWIDADNIVRDIAPLDEVNAARLNVNESNFPARLAPITQARLLRTPVVGEPKRLFHGYAGVVVYVPVYRGDQYLGVVVGSVRLKTLLALLNASIDPSLNTVSLRTDKVFVSIDGENVFDANGHEIVTPDGQVADAATYKQPHTVFTYTKGFPVDDIAWTVSVTPTVSNVHFSLEMPLIDFFATRLSLVVFGAMILYWLERHRRNIQAAMTRESDFVSIVSHQLREPISQMSAILEMLDSDLGETVGPKQRELLTDLEEINRANARLISNLLNVSRLERGTINVEQEPTPVADIVKHALSRIGTEEDVPVSVNTQGFETMVDVDQRLAADVIQNLIDNAFKHNGNGTRVSIRAEKNPPKGKFVLRIQDTGSGIPKDVQAHLFEKKTTIQNTTDHVSAGLGLYIVKKFMDLMDGKIWFKTSSKGTSFFLAFQIPSATKTKSPR